MSVETVLVARANGYAGLTALISTRFYYQQLPQNPTLPAVVYSRISAERPSCMGADAGLVRARFQLDVYAADPKSARLVMEQLRQCFQRWTNSSGTVVQDTFIVSDVDIGPDPDTLEHHSSLDIEVIYQE